MTVEAAVRPQVATHKESVRSKDGTRIGFARFGKGPGIVFVHGSISGRRDWFRVAEALADRFTCYLMDRRGRGLSEFGNADYSIEREHEDIAAVLKAAGPNASLVAHSYGATCALGAALLSPVKRMVLYEPPLPIHDLIAGEALAAYRHAANEARFDEAMEIGLREFVRLPAAKIESMKKTRMWPKLTALVPTWPRELEAMDAIGSPVDQYSRIACPTLILLGTESAQHPFRDAAAALEKVIPDVRIAPLERQSHLALRVAPQLVIEKVAAFLAE